jgi:UDP-N-acetylglucosamine 2-epimerase (non-hydrolysing)
MVLITGHRRENFGESIEQICWAIGMLAERFPEHLFVCPVHLNPNVLLHVNRLWAGCRMSPSPQLRRTRCRLCCQFRRSPGGGAVTVLLMRDTTEHPEGNATGTTLLTGGNAQAIVEHATRLLTDEVAYRFNGQCKESLRGRLRRQ